MPTGRQVVALVLTIIVVAVVLLSYLVWVEQSQRVPSTEYEVSLREGRTVAINLLTGEVEHQSGSPTEVLRWVVRSLPSGGTITVRSGTYELDGNVELGSNIVLRGEGDLSTVFTAEEKSLLVVKDRSNVALSDLRLVGSTGIYVAADRADVTGVQVRGVEATVSRAMGAAFTLAPNGRTISQVSFVNCRAEGGDAYGFLNIGTRGRSLVSDITYQDCVAVGNGVSSRSHDWTVGFDLAEQTDVMGMTLVNCTANENWESGFHFEDDVRTAGVLFQDCVANDNGRSKPSPLYGAGFVVQSHTELVECTALNNANGGLLILGDPETIQTKGFDGTVIDHSASPIDASPVTER